MPAPPPDRELALIVDDDRSVRYTLRAYLEDAQFEVVEAEDGVAALEAIDRREPDLVITDLRMPRLDGLGLLAALAARRSMPLVIMLTAHGSERHAVEALKQGAFDYFKKPFDPDELEAALTRVRDVVRLRHGKERAEAELNLARSLVFESEAMGRLAMWVRRVAPRPVTVLVRGESGTGKERVAEAIVRASDRATKPYLRFNCAAIQPELAEAELFGHTKGAFTGAHRARPGLFREAHGGTVLLDEVGELDPRTQAKLLRVLQEGEVRPVGDEHAIPVDVRVIAATHRDLAKEVELGRFREDLYYRLKVVELQVPSLRERKSDIPVLFRHFLDRYTARFGTGPLHVEPDVLDRLRAHDWPGNVRELENLVESMVALSSDGAVERAVVDALDPVQPSAVRAPDDTPHLGLKERLEAYERGVIVQVLEECRGHRTEAARRLGIGRATLHEKLHKYGLAVD